MSARCLELAMSIDIQVPGGEDRIHEGHGLDLVCSIYHVTE